MVVYAFGMQIHTDLKIAWAIIWNAFGVWRRSREGTIIYAGSSGKLIFEFSNSVAVGYDEGTILVKMGRDEPAVTMDLNGKLIWARHSELCQGLFFKVFRIL